MFLKYIKDLGALKYFLSIEVHDSNKGSTYLNTSMVLSIRVKQATWRPAYRFFDFKKYLKLKANVGLVLQNPLQCYDCLVGCLLYLNARPSIVCFVNGLSQSMSQPWELHQAALHAVHHIK